MKLYGRKAVLQLDTIRIPGNTLRFDFKISKNLKPEPNTGEVNVYNLNPQHIHQLSQLKKAVVKLEAGYDEGTSQILLSDLRNGFTTWDSTERITTFSTGDGEKAFQGARINQTFGPKTSADTVLYAMAKALGVGHGNIAAVAAKLRFSGAANMFVGGCTITGQVSRELTDFCKSADLEWSIQDNNIQILDRGKALLGKVLVLSPTSGLVGSPKLDAKGNVNATALLVPDIRPGQLVSILAEEVHGFFRLSKVDYSGDTRSDEWYAAFEGTPVKTVP